MALLNCTWTDPETGINGYLSIHRLVRGLSAGGCRVLPGLTLEEMERLAETMTYKFALFGIPIGGAKCGLNCNPSRPDLKEILGRFFKCISPFLRESFLTGQDLGTDEETIAEVLRSAGINSLAEAAVNSWGVPRERVDTIARTLRLDAGGGMLVEDMLAGYGVSCCALETLDSLGMDPAKARASVQGFGNVGGAACRYLHEAGVKVVAVADKIGSVINPQGLDIPLMLQHRRGLGIMDRERLPAGAVEAPAHAWLEADAELLLPCAVSDAITPHNSYMVRARAVVEGANIPMREELEAELCKRGIMVIPDFLANSAFAMVFSAILLGEVGPDLEAIKGLVSSRLRGLAREVIRGFREGREPRAVLRDIAEQNLRKGDESAARSG